MEHGIVASLLTLIDGLERLKGVVVAGTTNRIDAIDMALRRAGRLGLEIYVSAPDNLGRKEILEIHTLKMPLAPDVNLNLVAQDCGLCGADIPSLSLEAAYNTLRRRCGPAILGRIHICSKPRKYDIRFHVARNQEGTILGRTPCW